MKNECMRRAPLEKGRDGLVEGHCDFYFSANLTRLEEWVDNPNVIDDLAVLHVFGKYLLTAGLSRAMHDQRIPVREIAKPMEINR